MKPQTNNTQTGDAIVPPEQGGNTPPIDEKTALEAQLNKAAEQAADVIKSAAFMGKDEGKAFVESHSEQLFNKVYGGGQSEELEVKDANRAEDDALKQLKDAKKAKADTAERLPSIALNEDGSYKRTPLKDWQPQDLCLWTMILPIVFILMGVSVVNVQVNITATGSAAFIGDNEWKSWVMASLAGAMPFVLKLFPSVFVRVSHQELAKRGMTALTIVVIVWWAVLFAERFEGVGATVALEDMFSGSGNNNFVFVQTIAEMLIASSLFICLQNIWDKYAPDTLNINPAYSLVMDSHDQAEALHQQCLERQKSAVRKLSDYQADKQAFIDKHVAAFHMTFTRHQSLHN